jgi:RNA polymerase sigma factor (sigma-70 family)
MAAVPTIGRASGVERSPAAPEADATRALYERYSRQILNYCVHQLNSREEAEDAVQTTFMNAFRGLKRGIVPEAEQAWLFKIAENVCLSRRRSSWRRGKVESPNDFEVLQEIVPSKHANRADELIGLEEALEAMPENQRRAILLREWQGLSYREISDELELSQAAVETLIFRARRSLAAGLENPAPAKKRRRISAAADGLSLGSLIAGLKSILTGGAAVKAVAVAVAAGSATVAATQAEPALVHRMHHATQPAATVHITKQSQATFSPQAAVVAGASGMSVVQANRKITSGASLHNSVAAPNGHGSAAQAPTEAATHTSTPPMVPAAPAPTTPAPEAPIAATPAPAAPIATPAEQPKSEPSAPAKTGHGNEGKGNDNRGNGNDAVQTKADTPKSEPSKGNGNGNGNGKSEAKSEAPKSDPAKAEETKSEAQKGKDKGDNGNGNGNDKKSEATRSLSAPAAATVPAAPAAPAPPVAPVQQEATSGNGNDKDKGKGSDKKQEAQAPAPAPVVVAAAVVASAVVVAPAPAAPAAAAPPVQASNPAGNNGSSSSNKDKSDKGKGK